MNKQQIALAHMSNIFNSSLLVRDFITFIVKNLKKGAIIQKGRNNSKKGAIKGAIKTLRTMLQTIGITRFSL